MRTTEVLGALQPHMHDALGDLAVVGRLPETCDELLVATAEPADPGRGTLVIVPKAELGPAIAVKDSALAHPDGLLAHILHGLGARREVPVGWGRAKLRKLTVFVPETHLEALRAALTSAGAGRIGHYSDCTFAVHGEGTFRPGAGARPFLGSEGELARVAEARLESVYPPYAERAILAAMRLAHPYEEIAYDVLELRNPDPTYGALRLADIEPAPLDAVLQQVLAASESNAMFVCDGAAGRIVRRVAIVGRTKVPRVLAASDPDLVIARHMPPHVAETLHRSGVHIVELHDLERCAMRHLARRLRQVASVPVRDASEGLVWRSYRNPGNIARC